jgi:CRISPR-associated helicase Cas3
MIRLQLEPVAYPVLDADWLPGKRPYPHQVETLRHMQQALERGESLCLFNASVTGGGKTLASFAYTLLTTKPAVGVYPTNELIEDQRRALQAEFPNEQRLFKIDSRELDRLEVDYERHGHARTLEMVLAWQPTILTNPDILYLVFFGCYIPKEKTKALMGLSERLHQRLIQNDIFIFDEFHLYNTKQIGNVATMIGALHALQRNRGKVFIFSSATPAQTMADLLDRLDIPFKTIKPPVVPPDTPNGRVVAHPVELFLVPADLAGWQAQEAIREHFALICDFVHDYPEARAVFILDSVAGAVRLASELKSHFGEPNVGEVHGLSSEDARREALRRRFTVGTSTIEVGIDFKDEHEKDLLIFEARAAAQFIQRLGRIGWHQKAAAIPNRSIALVPEYVHNFLKERLGTETSIGRQQLTDLVYDAYRTPNQFRSYLRRYTPVEAHALKEFVVHQFQPDDRPRIEHALTHTVEVMSERETSKIERQHNWLVACRMLAPLQSFRGHGLEVALWDNTERIGSPIKTYDLLFILRRGIFKELSGEEFFRRVEGWLEKHPEEERPLRRRLAMVGPDIDDLVGVYGYFELNGILPGARKVWFECYQSDIKEWHNLTCIQGLEVKTDPFCPVWRLNRLLRGKSFVVWLGRQDPFTLRFARGLPPLFEVYELRVRSNVGPRESRGSITFNQNAYFLDCLHWEDGDANVNEHGSAAGSG